MEFRREKEIVWKDGYCNAHFQRIIVEERNGIAQWNGINYRTRAIDESEEDSNADSDEKDEGNTEVTGRNSIKKKPSTMDPHVVQKRLRAAQSDDNTKQKRLNYVQVQGECIGLLCPNGMYLWQKESFQRGRPIGHISVKK